MTFRILLAGLGNRGKQWAGIVGDAPGVAEILERAAALPFADGCCRSRRELHRDADDVVALIAQEGRCDRAVDAAAHRDDDARAAHAATSTRRTTRDRPRCS